MPTVTKKLCYAAFCSALLLIALGGMLPVAAPAHAEQSTARLDGIWFTCEFAKRTSPPDDDCRMLDDEGFEMRSGQLTYLRNRFSEEEACKGQKKGQCFRADEKEIIVSRRKIGRIDIDNYLLKLRYLGCTQRYHLTPSEHYVAVIPDEEKCFWATQRHFYVTRYTGKLTTP